MGVTGDAKKRGERRGRSHVCRSPSGWRIQDYAARASWPAGFQIYERGTSADGVFIVVRGRVVLRSRVRAGRGFVPWVATPGETFGAEGLSPNGAYATDARADEETETLFLSTTKLRAFIREQPVHALAVVGQVMAERTSLLEKLRELTTLSVEQRLVAALRRMAAHDSFTQSDGRIELCSARYRLLCELVGATRESVSLVLGRLSGEGLVEREREHPLRHAIGAPVRTAGRRALGRRLAAGRGAGRRRARRRRCSSLSHRTGARAGYILDQPANAHVHPVRQPLVRTRRGLDPIGQDRSPSAAVMLGWLLLPIAAGAGAAWRAVGVAPRRARLRRAQRQMRRRRRGRRRVVHARRDEWSRAAAPARLR